MPSVQCGALFVFDHNFPIENLTDQGDDLRVFVTASGGLGRHL
jgi:hypothetical protein